jgi:hypothetical protein
MGTGIFFLFLVLGLVISTPVLLFTFARQNVAKVSQQLNLVGKDIFEIRFYQILKAFLTGHNQALKMPYEKETLKKSLETEFNPYYRGFAYEGTGMGFAVRSTLYLNRGYMFEGFIHSLSPNHIYQYYVGLGWWLHMLYGFRKRGYQRWLKQLDQRYSLILFDGVGFRTGIFNYSKNPKIINKFNQFSPSYKRVCYQGFGRSLWFQKLFNMNEVLIAMEGLPDESLEDTMSGLGLAVAYSMFDDVEYSLRIAKLIPAKYKAAFTQGMAFGWEARYLQNRKYWNQILSGNSEETKQRLNDLIRLVHQAKQTLDYTDDYYIQWIDTTRELIKKNVFEEVRK